MKTFAATVALSSALLFAGTAFAGTSHRGALNGIHASKQFKAKTAAYALTGERQVMTRYNDHKTVIKGARNAY